MRLGVNLIPGAELELATAAERLGLATALAPEGHRDAVTVLSWVAGQTSRLTFVSGVCQIPARTPVSAAVTAATLNALCGGRFRLGLGISTAFTTDSWHGQPFGRPLGRTRDYVEIVRTALRGDPVAHRGAHLSVPHGADTAPFRMAPDPHRTPILLAATGPRNLELAGEIADGWIGSFCSPEQATAALPHLRTGRARAGATLDGFEVLLSVPIAVGDDVEDLARPVARYVARFLAMGPADANPYHRLAVRLGLAEEAARVRERTAAGDHAGAAAAVPTAFVDSMALLGPPARVQRRLGEFAAAGVTTLCVGPTAASAAERRTALEVAAAGVAVGAP